MVNKSVCMTVNQLREMLNEATEEGVDVVEFCMDVDDETKECTYFAIKGYDMFGCFVDTFTENFF